MNDISRIFYTFVFGLGQPFSKTYEKKKKRYAYLVVENVGNFQMSKDDIVVLTHIAWAAITISVIKGFLRTFTQRRGHAVPRFVV